MNKKLLFGVVFLVLLYSVSAVLDDAVLYYSLDDSDLSGSNPLDSSGNTNTGTNNGATTGATGTVNEGFDFESSEGDYVDIGNTASTSITGAWSISAWIKIESSQVYNVIAIKGATASTYPSYALLISGLNPRIYSNGASGSQSGGFITSSTTLNTGQWYHIVGVFEGTGATQTKIYVDGALDTSGQTETPYSSSNALELGRWVTGGNLDGIIDEVAIYDRALTTDEIAELYNSGSGFNPYDVTPATPHFDVTATDADTSATLYNITVTLQNGTQYTNVSNAIVTTPFNDSSLRNFTVSISRGTNNALFPYGLNTIYYNQTFTNYNTSVDLQVNLTRYPYIQLINAYNSSALSKWTSTTSIGCYATESVGGGCGIGIFTNGKLYLPINQSTTVAISKNTFYSQTVTHDFTGAVDVNITTFQAERRFNATQIITGSAVSPANFTINGVTKGIDEPFYLDAQVFGVGGEYTVTFTKAGYISKNQTITVTALTNTTETITGVGSSSATIYVRELIYNTTVTNFTLNISNAYYDYEDTYVVTDGSAEVSIAQDVPFNITIDADGYAIREFTNTYTETAQNQTVYVYITNSIYAQFFDASTNALIDDRNISIEILSDVFNANFTTPNGTKYITLLTPTTYTIRYSTTGYEEGFYIATVSDRSNTTLYLYLENSSNVQDVTISIVDETNEPLQNAIVKILKYFTSTNSYTQVGVVSTNFDGKVVFPMEMASEYYKFIVEYPAGTVVKSTSPTYIYQTTITIVAQLTQSAGADFYRLLDISSNLVFNNATNNFRFTYTDSSNTITSGCLYVYKVTPIKTTLYNSSCVSSASSTILVGVEQINGTHYKAKAYVAYDADDTVLVNELDYTFYVSTLTSDSALFLVFILTAIFAFMGIWSPSVASIITPIPLVVASWAGIISIPFGVSIAILALGAIVAYIMGNKT